MRVGFEFLALFREKAGAERLELEVGADAPPAGAVGRTGAERLTVLDALKALQDALAERGVRFLEGRNLAAGILVFVRGAGGGLTRVPDPDGMRIGEGERVVLSTAMAGG